MVNVLFSAVSARRGGGQTYVRNIVESFPSEGGHRLTLLSPDPLPGLPDHPAVEWEQAPGWTRLPIPRRLLGAIYFRFFWPRRHDFDVVYYAGGSPDISLPSGVKMVVAFRNMLPFDRPARRRYHWGWNRIRHAILEYVQASAFRKADLVIFISDYARRVIDRRVPRRRGSSIVIPHGARRTAGKLDSALAAQLPAQYVLYLSILDPYKAHLELVEAWELLRERRHTKEKLVLAGPDATPYGQRVREAIAARGLQDEVLVLGAVAHDQVSDIAGRAKLNVFLSACENCPNILLELMCSGVPVLVSSKEPMPELGGEGLDYVDPYDPSEVAEALGGLLDNPQKRAANAAAASERSRHYTWERAGVQTWANILRCAGAPGPIEVEGISHGSISNV